MTASTSSTSMPREATSVATSTGSLPLRKAAMVFSRVACLMSPCRQSAWIPLRRSASLRFWHITLVLQKMMTRSNTPERRMRSVASSFSSRGTVMEYWSMSGLLSAVGATVISTSSRWYIQLTVMTSCEMVAENRPRFTRFLMRLRILVTSSKKPMSSIRSASSRMTVLMRSRRRFLRL